MPNINNQLLTVLNEIKGNGYFASKGSTPFIFPGLKIRGMGEEIGFPIDHSQIKKLIKTAHKASFGKGSKTVLDTSVRSAWEIDASQIGLNAEWAKSITSILKQVKPDLGIESYAVSAHLYKLLIYEKDDFFLAHKDSEKETGMFGTLIIGLPTRYTGGELAIRFDGREEIIDFSVASREYKLPYAAFYADCEHEIKPIISGYRVCLVYNLIQDKGKDQIQLYRIEEHVKNLTAILREGEKDQDIPKIVLLGHQYTSSNFTMKALKLNDRPKAEALLKAAELAGYYGKLGLVTSFQSGELILEYNPPSRYRRRHYDDSYDDYDDDDELAENGTMGEIYDEHVEVDHWMEEGVPPLRNIHVEQKDLILGIHLNEGEPIEKYAEGYTGNAGMEMQYWYHYGAIFLWPKKKQYDMLIDLDTSNQLEWIDFYNRNWNTLRKADIDIARRVAENGLKITHDDKIDFSPLAELLVNLGDKNYLGKKGMGLLVNHFTQIPVDGWLKLFEAYPLTYFTNIFTSAADMGKILILRYLLVILNKLFITDPRAYKSFLANQIKQIPGYLSNLKLSNPKENAPVKDILRNVLEINKQDAGRKAPWIKETSIAFTKDLNREYVNDILLAETLKFGEKTALTQKIMDICREDLLRRAQRKPKPPANWSRKVPGISGIYGEQWKVLADFLKSPTEQVFDYQKIKGMRTTMEHAIRSVVIDLKMETISKGSPHTLRLTKTQAAYQREVKKWEKDVELLKIAEAW